MKKNTIVQFVCFTTDLELDDFVPKWERYAKRLMIHNPETTLQQAETKSKFRYISQHEWQEGDFHFTFMNQKRSEHFPEHNVKVVQIGGYTLLETENRNRIAKNGSAKLIAFISQDEYEIGFYRQLPFYNRLNIYQPYYESCSYGHVLEFFVPEMNADELVRQIKQRKGADTGIYKECMMYHL
ncbi:MAG TPA: hypothetical protein VJU78_01710 [Chitinophagaceae bacterium]|nr:hypothetical protein [Chitinophagaceae bacterium]